jgi:putative salt-induced outer membrane protein YdiY
MAAVLAALVFVGTALAGAQESTPPSADASSSRWTFTLDVGATGAAGNARSLTLVGGVAARFVGTRWTWSFDSDVTVVDVESRTNGDDGEGERHEDHEVESKLLRHFGSSSRLYAVAKGVWDRKPGSGIASELKIEAGLGAHLLHTDRVVLDVEAGVSRVDERFTADAPPLDYGSLFLHSRWTWTYRSGASLSWTNDLRFGTEEGSDLKSDQELELDAPLAEHLSIGLQLEWERNSDPPADVERNDYRLLTKLTVRL